MTKQHTNAQEELLMNRLVAIILEANGDAYSKAELIQAEISTQREQAQQELLEGFESNVLDENYDEVFGTYDYDGVAGDSLVWFATKRESLKERSETKENV